MHTVRETLCPQMYRALRSDKRNPCAGPEVPDPQLVTANLKNNSGEGDSTMGDKGGKKDKDKSHKQNDKKQKKKDKDKVDKQPKSKV